MPLNPAVVVKERRSMPQRAEGGRSRRRSAGVGSFIVEGLWLPGSEVSSGFLQISVAMASSWWRGYVLSKHDRGICEENEGT